MPELLHRDVRDFPAAQLSALQFELRLGGASDEPFLYYLFESTHGLQFAVLPLAPAQREMLVRMQFEAQRSGYRAQFPESQDFVIIAGGEPVGRLWLDESGATARVLDIVIAPGQQGRGIGRAVLEQVIEKAESARKAVQLYVDRMNGRAFELYQRLGFIVNSGDEIRLEMVRVPQERADRERL